MTLSLAAPPPVAGSSWTNTVLSVIAGGTLAASAFIGYNIYTAAVQGSRGEEGGGLPGEPLCSEYSRLSLVLEEQSTKLAEATASLKDISLTLSKYIDHMHQSSKGGRASLSQEVRREEGMSRLVSHTL